MTIQSDNTEQAISPGFSIIHANHLEDLRQVAVSWIKKHPIGVLEIEQFLVQSNGMAQWLKLALAADDGCGISAGLDMKLPGRYVWTAYRAILGGDTIPEESPYDKNHLIWRIFRLLPQLAGEPVFYPINRFLDGDKDLRKRIQLAGHLADLYDQYQVYRADWLADWANGLDRLGRIGGGPIPLDENQVWQAELWRRIRNDLPPGSKDLSRADLHNNFLAKAASLKGQRPPELPPRVIVFGITSLPRQVLETLSAVSTMCQILLFVHNPCRHFWADIVEDRELLRIEQRRHRTKAGLPRLLDPELIHQHANPLLAAWGKQGRDYIGLLYGYDEPEKYEADFAQIDLFDNFITTEGNNTLLQMVQQAVLDLEPLPGGEAKKQLVAAADQSICFHVAHSRQREVEILQDQLLHCFETLDALNPRDVIIMTPDIEAYAPHIEAVFGNLSVTDPRYIPFTIADKPNRESVPLLKALSALLHLPDSRFGVSDVMDLLDVGAFRKRFTIDENDLRQLKQWIEGAGISWGLSGDQRALFDLPGGLEQNTWRFGLERMLLGYATGNSGEWNAIEPYEEIGGLDAALVGPLFDVINQLDRLWQELNQPGTPETWCQRIRNLVRDCFVSRESQDQLTLSRLDQVLDQWLDACDQAMLDDQLPLGVVRDFILADMKESSISQRFLAGMINFGTLMPMRAIPFKVVCLLGMNDGDFPRTNPPLDFDLMAGKGLYRPGDRSRREDDRYLFLEALLSARQRLYISFVGRDERDNSERMPSVLVGQFRDYLSAGWRMDDNDELLDVLTHIHPLQPFSRDYFTGNDAGLFTYAHEWRATLETPKVEDPNGNFDQVLTAPDFDGNLNLTTLINFYKNPVKHFFRQRLSVRFEDVSVTGQDQEPFALDFLAPFGIGMQLLSAGMHADPSSVQDAVEKESLRLTRTGELPMAGFGSLAAKALASPVIDILKHRQSLLDEWPCPCDPIEISLQIEADGIPAISIDDWLDEIYTVNGTGTQGDNQNRFARWEIYPKSILGSKGKVSKVHSLAGIWVKHLAANAQGVVLFSHLVAPDGIAAIPPVPQAQAQKLLEDLVFYSFKGLSQPLPVTAKSGLAYTQAMVVNPGKKTPEEINEKACKDAAKAYQGDGYYSRGQLEYDAYLRRTYPGFEQLWRAQDNLFITLCKAMYEPLVIALESEV